MRDLVWLRLSLLALIGCGTLISIALGPASAQPVHDFYRGKTLTIVVGSDITGEHDAAARLLSRHLSKYIPGRPAIIVQNMPGASGIKSANYLWRAATARSWRRSTRACRPTRRPACRTLIT